METDTHVTLAWRLSQSHFDLAYSDAARQLYCAPQFFDFCLTPHSLHHGNASVEVAAVTGSDAHVVVDKLRVCTTDHLRGQIFTVEQVCGCVYVGVGM